MKRSLLLISAGMGLMGIAVGAVNAQDYRMFLETDDVLPVQSVPSDPDGTGPQSGVGFDQNVTGGQGVTVFLFVEKIGPGPTLLVRGTQFRMPCSVPCSFAGSVTYVDMSIAVNTMHPLYVLLGLVNFPALDNGPCPAESPWIGTAAPAGGNPVTTPRYAGQADYTVSADCSGTATFLVPNEPDTALRDQNAMPIPFSTDGFSLDIGGPDADGDGIADCIDNCDLVNNPGQENDDTDALGNACDNCDLVDNPGQEDGDSDGVGNVCDNCPTVSNPGQENRDNDSRGDKCDNCPFDDNENQSDADRDGEGDPCDPCPNESDDTDQDGIDNGCDPCPSVQTNSCPQEAPSARWEHMSDIMNPG